MRRALGHPEAEHPEQLVGHIDRGRKLGRPAEQFIAAGLLRDLDHGDRGAVPLGNVDSPRDRHSVANPQVRHGPRNGNSTATLHEQAVVSGHTNRASVLCGHLEARASRSMPDEGRGRARADSSSRVERRDRVTGQRDLVADAVGEVADPFPSELDAVVVQDLLVGEDAVEDPHDPHVEMVVAVVGRGHRLGVALRLVVHAAGADRVDVAPVRLGLRVHEWVAVDLGRRRQEERRSLGLGETEAVVRAEPADLQDLDGDALEVDRRRRAGEVHDHIDVTGHPEVRADVVFDEREPAAAEQSFDVGDGAGDEVVDRHDVVAPIEQRSTQV